MSSLLDDGVVGILVLGATAYAATSLGPRRWRGRALAALSGVLQRTPSAFGLRGLARRWGDKAAAKTAGACGGCDSCESETAKDQPNPLGSNEVRIPLSKIGKRT